MNEKKNEKENWMKMATEGQETVGNNSGKELKFLVTNKLKPKKVYYISRWKYSFQRTFDFIR